ncbi:acyltransferase family protein [Paenibacillus sp. 23TSA30-6]|uniref:acyltransferase family protein n=1 Tax=Paenibacillus sp. 23TSA30-6 TaxID=2546104 RepID=UPI001788866B|nr:acyltransferase [Paenibacillus sp. 23TSA30-6]MBE0335486.1 acyltransferase [Paenibacillus sp. 23TSA30-6]
MPVAKGETEHNKLQFVDTLRALAIMGVLLVHVSQHVEGLNGWLQKGLSLGAKGVALFYLASSFTLFLSLSRRMGDGKEGVSAYLVRRFFRIAPLYYVMLIIYLVVNGTGPRFWLGDQEGVTVANIAAHILFLNGLNPYWINSIIGVEWSIAVECIFYLCVPLLFKLIQSIRHAAWFVTDALVLSFGLNTVFAYAPWISDHSLWGHYLYLWFPNQLPVFGLGVLLFFIWKDERHWKSMDRFSGGLLLGSVLFSLCTGMTDYLIGVLLLLAAYALYHWQPVWLLNRGWSWIGCLSYSMYLTHLLALEMVNQIELPFSPVVNMTLMFIMTLLLTTGLSWLTYSWIEQPGIRWGKKIISRMKSVRSQKDSVKESVA